MSTHFVMVDRVTPMLFPPDLRDWIPDHIMVRFIVEALDTLDIQKFSINQRRSGCTQYPAAMMLALPIYCYVTGRFSSRAIEEASWYDIAVRFICGGDKHPNHDTICPFQMFNVG